MSKSSKVNFSVENPHAAGIDVGSRSHWACVGDNKEDIREFSVFTDSLHEMARWFKSEEIKTIAMESTGFYWKSLFLLLQSYGFEVLLVNAQYVKNVSGRKSDQKDCEWIRKLHRAGLLHASFQPDSFTEEIRTYTRQRKSLIEGASRYVAKMQKSMVVMNIQLSVVLSDITGKSGQAIIRAILQGERDPNTLALLADYRVKADKQTIARSLTGQWQSQYLFQLEQDWNTYHHFMAQIQQCDERIDELLTEKVHETGQEELYYESVVKKKVAKNDPKFPLPQHAFQLSDGVDLMELDGVSYRTILTLIGEVGLDLSKFPSGKHFASWLCLCPNKKITGGKVISSKSRKNKSRLAAAFRQAGNSVGRTDTALGYQFRALAYRKGRKVAIQATARKIAITVYNMLEKGQPYQPQSREEYVEKVRKQKIRNIQKTIKKLGLTQQELMTA